MKLFVIGSFDGNLFRFHQDISMIVKLSLISFIIFLRKFCSICILSFVFPFHRTF